MALCILGWSVAGAPALIAIVLPSVFGLLVLLLLTRSIMGEADQNLYRTVATWTLIGFALHAAIGIAIVSSKAAVSFFGPDAATYHAGAKQLAESWTGHAPNLHLANGKEGFFYLLGGLYYVFGAHPATGVIVNATMSAATIPIMTDLTRRLGGTRAASFVPPLLVLLPGFLVWQSQLLREAGVTFLIAIAAYAAIRLASRTEPRTIFVLAGSLALLLTFRSNVALLLAIGLILGLAVGRGRIVAGLGSGISTLSILAVLVLSFGIGYSGYRFASGADLQTANAARLELSTTANSGLASNTDISTTSRAVSSLPITLVQFSGGPFPWQVGGPRQLPGLADAVSLWILFPSLVRGVRAVRRRIVRRSYVLILPALMIAAMLALVIGNYGSILRERPQVIILLVPFIAVGLANRQRPDGGSFQLGSPSSTEQIGVAQEQV